MSEDKRRKLIAEAVAPIGDVDPQWSSDTCILNHIHRMERALPVAVELIGELDRQVMERGDAIRLWRERTLARDVSIVEQAKEIERLKDRARKLEEGPDDSWEDAFWEDEYCYGSDE